MGRITGPRVAYGHSVRYAGFGCWFIGWTIDRKIRGSRLRWPTSYKRLTTETKARKFAQKHGIAFKEAR